MAFASLSREIRRALRNTFAWRELSWDPHDAFSRPTGPSRTFHQLAWDLSWDQFPYLTALQQTGSQNVSLKQKG